ncbi:FAD-dependent thymidylate synthase [Fervidicoccus fontis]|uniref:Flavin-dependent thymidylate synthase n=1 Tax=Fervidicoccus fontis TaxID=683846 RepID=A0A7C2VAE3_9CREN|nr:FAD-dependent thymidylate synthase [Fervidicoccus fontis]PMB77154.1 MAG: thymidylate synthase (FAD) [Fervidicoccus fontis]HEW63640.1 FAD-dependent thymidylate synthase [Fervidicoccus fontis]
MKVTLISYTKECEKLIAVAAKQTITQKEFSESWNEMKEDEKKEWLKETMSRGHTSPWEHCTYTFLIEDVSRVLTHQLVRHRLASYSQLSQRYKRIKEIENYYVIPKSILKKGGKALEKYINSIKKSFEEYQELINMGMPPEDARYVLPQAVKTKIVVTMNARELLNFFGLRMCMKAQWEIRALAWNIYYIVKSIHPDLWKFVGPRCLQLENMARMKPIELEELLKNDNINLIIEKCPEGVARENIKLCVRTALNDIREFLESANPNNGENKI